VEDPNRGRGPARRGGRRNDAPPGGVHPRGAQQDGGRGGRPQQGRGGPQSGRGPGGGPPQGRGGGGGGAPHQRGEQGGRSVPRGQLPDDLVYGINAVGVALDTGQLKVLFFDQGRQTERMQHLHAQAVSQGVEVRPLQKQGWSRVLPPDQHQGMAGLLHATPNYYIEEIVAEAKDDSCILVLDRIQDPQNLGAVLRTAAATGVDAVVLPKAGGCPVTAAVHKAAAGLSLRVRIVEDENLARALDYLKQHGYWVIGCDSGDGEDATTFEFPHKRVLVLGNEAEGMRRLTRESCDYIVRIPMAPGIDSLNISVATAVVIYLAVADLSRAALEAEPAAQ
jgi:23S rRNA (guanosine2251-2'-O)-methyltransferase